MYASPNIATMQAQQDQAIEAAAGYKLKLEEQFLPAFNATQVAHTEKIAAFSTQIGRHLTEYEGKYTPTRIELNKQGAMGFAALMAALCCSFGIRYSRLHRHRFRALFYTVGNAPLLITAYKTWGIVSNDYLDLDNPTVREQEEALLASPTCLFTRYLDHLERYKIVTREGSSWTTRNLGVSDIAHYSLLGQRLKERDQDAKKEAYYLVNELGLAYQAGRAKHLSNVSLLVDGYLSSRSSVDRVRNEKIEEARRKQEKVLIEKEIANGVVLGVAGCAEGFGGEALNIGGSLGVNVYFGRQEDDLDRQKIKARQQAELLASPVTKIRDETRMEIDNEARDLTSKVNSYFKEIFNRNRTRSEGVTPSGAPPAMQTASGQRDEPRSTL